eukprot:tig00021590_g22760.t1
MNECVATASAFIHAVPWELALVGLAVNVCYVRHDSLGKNWVWHFLFSFMSCFGGSTMGSLFIGDPVKWAANDKVVAIFAACWVAVLLSPGDIVFKALRRIAPLRAVLFALGQVSRTRVIVTGVTRTAAKYPGAMFSTVVMGSLWGFGGTLWGNMDRYLSGDKTTPGEIRSPTWSSKSALSCGLLYFLVAFPSPLFPEGNPFVKDARLFEAGLIAFFVGHAFIKNLLYDPLGAAGKGPAAPGPRAQAAKKTV